MTTRILDATEWARVPTDLHALLPHVIPGDAQVVVVEDAGRIVASWAVLRVVHLEGLWIDPAYRGRAGVARRLYEATLTAARRWTSGWAMTGAATDDVRALLDHAGAQKLPMDTYVMPLRDREASRAA